MRFPHARGLVNQFTAVRDAARRTFSSAHADRTKPDKNSSGKIPENKDTGDGKSNKNTPDADQKALKIAGGEKQVANLPRYDAVSKYFARFARPPYNFVYNPTKTYTDEYARLRNILKKFFGWAKNDARFDQEYKLYSGAVNTAFEDNMEKLSGKKFAGKGKQRELEILQAICTTLGIKPPPPTIIACRQAIRRININMVDFDHAVRMNNGSYTKHGVKNISGNIMAQVRRFPSERSLSEYTLALDRKYPLYVAKEHTLMRSLLRHIDNPQD